MTYPETNKTKVLNMLADHKQSLWEINLSKEFADDIDVLKAAVDNNPWLIKFASMRLRQDKMFFQYCISKNPRVFEHFEQSLFFNNELVIELLEKLIPIEGQRIYLKLLTSIPPTLLQNREISSRMTLLCLDHYKILDDEQKNDKEFIMRLAARHRQAITMVPKCFLDDPDVISATISNFPLNIRYFSLETKSDKDLGLIAVKKNAGALKYLSPELKDDYEIVKAAIKKTGLAIQYASPRLRSNEELALYAMRRNTHGEIILDKLDPSLYSNKKVITSAIYGDFEKTARLADETLLNDSGVLDMINKRLSKDKYGYYKSEIKKASLRLKLENCQRYGSLSDNVLQMISNLTR